MNNDKLALYLSAEKYRLAKNMTKAIKLYREIVEIEPDDLGILKKLTAIYEKEHQNPEAAEMYEKIARVYLDRAQPDLALEMAQKSLELDPGNRGASEIAHDIKNKQKEAEQAKAPAVVPKERPVEPEVPPIRLDTPLFKDMNEEQLEMIVKVIIPLKMLKGTRVFEEGELSNSLYIISEGSFEVRTKVSSVDEEHDTVFSVLTPGHFFGEFAFLTNCPRVATVTAREDSLVYQLTKENLDEIIKQYPEVEERLFLFYKSRALDLVLAKSPLFRGISIEERREMLELFVLKKFKSGDYLIREGQKDDNLFLIKKGELRVETTTHKDKKVFLNTLGQHQFFGEISFLTGLPRTADVIAVTDCEILLIGKEDLETLIIKHPHIEEVLKRFQNYRAVSTAEKLIQSN
ncbi:cyclic nucleotide-binding domain-containing protein [bacterium]|nr:cyclic nucleotide-binding domain-containing protein [bacterium]